MKKLDGVIIDVLGELTGWKGAATTRTVDKTGPGGSRNRGQFAKSYPIGSMIADPDERPELKDGEEPDIEMFGEASDEFNPFAGEKKANYDLDKVIKSSWFIEKMAEKGYNVSGASVLGFGAAGTAFDIGGGKVAKMTTDEDEARTSAFMKGKSKGNVVRVFDVFRIKKESFKEIGWTPANPGLNNDMFVVVQERLTPLSGGEKKRLDDAFKRLNKATGKNNVRMFMSGASWAGFVQQMRRIAKSGQEDEVIEALGELKAFGIDKMMDELDANEVDFFDYHGGNLMKKGSRYVITDLGFSVAPDADMATLEATTKTTVKNSSIGAPVKLKPDFFEPWKEKLRARGYDVDGTTVLGSGQNGTAFALRDGRVLKVTKDDREARTSKYAMSKNLKHVAEFYDVFQFPKPDDHYYGIIQERLTPLSDGEKRAFESWDDLLNRVTSKKREKKNTAWASAEIGGRSWNDFARTMWDWRNDDETDTRNKLMMALHKLEKFGMKDMADELKGAGIDFVDYHGGNIMRRDGEFVITDLGVSKSPDPGNIPVLESIIDQLVREVGDEFNPFLTDKPPAGGENVENYVKRFAEKLKRRGIDIEGMRYIDEGSMGTAFLLRSGRVLKYTEDKREAVASANLKGKTNEYILDIYDVFRFENGADEFGILEEKLDKISGEVREELNKIASKLNNMADLQAMRNGWTSFMEHIKDRYSEEIAKNIIDTYENYNIDMMMDELHANRIGFHDYHGGNVMMKNGHFAAIDLGVSKAPYKDIPVLERMVDETVRSLFETKADTIAVVLGRFQPFHKDWSEEIRQLAREFTKVILIVAGNRRDEDNPFSYDARVEMIRASMPDVEPKLEVHRATEDGQESFYLPGIIEDIIEDSNSSIEIDTATTVLSDPEHLDQVKMQFQEEREKGDDGVLDPDLYHVQKFDPLSDEEGKVLNVETKRALRDDDKEAFRGMVDEHLASNEQRFDHIYQMLRDEMEPEMVGPDDVEEMVEGKIGFPSELRAAFKKVSPDTRNKAKMFAKKYGGMEVLIGIISELVRWIHGTGFDKGFVKESGQKTLSSHVQFLLKNKAAREELFGNIAEDIELYRGVRLPLPIKYKLGQVIQPKVKGMFSSWTDRLDIAQTFALEIRNDEYGVILRHVGPLNILFSSKSSTIPWFNELYDAYEDELGIGSGGYEGSLREVEHEFVLIGKRLKTEIYDIAIENAADSSGYSWKSGEQIDVEEMVESMMMEFMGSGVKGGTMIGGGLGHVAGTGGAGSSAWSNSSMRRYTDPSIYGNDFSAGDVKRGDDDEDEGID